MINRKEAKEIGFENLVESADSRNERAIELLLAAYVDYMNLEDDFNVAAILGKEDKKEILVNRAVVHSGKLRYSFRSSYLLAKVPDPSGNVQMNVNITSTQWIKV